MARALPREWYGDVVRNGGVRRERARPARRVLASWAAGLALLLACLLLSVFQGVRVIRMGYEADRLQDRYRELRTERERLEIELASLQNLQVVAREAVRRHGMVFPGPEQVIVVRELGPSEPVAAAEAVAGEAVAGERLAAAR